MSAFDRSFLLAFRWLAASMVAASAGAQTSMFHLPGSATFDGFGHAVAGLGDLNGDGLDDFAVGIPGQANAGGIDAGAVRVSSGKDGSQLFELHGFFAGDNFGASVASAGDVNADGVPDLIVGAPKNVGAFGPATGAAYVFSGVAVAALAGPMYPPFSGDSAGDYFGWSVAGVGDLNSDGFDDFAVGAPFDNAHGVGSGSVRVLSGATGLLFGTIAGQLAFDQFGYSVAAAGDVNGDGILDLIVGAPQEDLNGVDSGSARVFSGANGTTLRTYAGDGAGDALGWSVAGVGDLNGDGFDDVMAGAPGDDNTGSGSGMVRVYSGAMPTPGVPALFTFNGIGAGDELGWSSGGAGDVTGDGVADVVVGAPLSDKAGTDSGSAYVFSGANGSLRYAFHGLTVSGQLGRAVGGAGDANSDGYADLLVGAEYEDNALPTTGGVWVFSGQECPISTYCTAKVNSLGCTPSIGTLGIPLASGGSGVFQLTAAQVLNNQNGIFIWALGPAAIPFGGGTLCLAPPITRTSALSSGGSPPPTSDCSGFYAFSFSQAYMASQGLGGGSTFYGQFWSRDPGFLVPNNVGLTNAVKFTICP